MKTLPVKKTILLCAVSACTAFGAWAATSGELLQQGLYAEEIEGDLPAAIASYEKIVADSSAPSNHVAQALYHEGMCYMRLKEDAKAVVALTRLVTNYSSQTNVVEKAQPILASLQFFDPATLMPPDTLAYLELGSTGRQIETILEMLKGTPLEDPLMAISQGNPDAMRSGEGALVAGLLNPAMKEEFKKIRGLAVGLVDITPQGPSSVAVLHLGESAMLRGLLMTGLSMVGVPGGTVDGMSIYSIQGQVEVACDDKVFLLSQPTGRLPWMIRQYKHLSADASLASSNPSFSQVDKAARQQNLTTFWLNADDMYTRFLQQVPNVPMEIRGPAGMINIASMDDLVLTAFVEPDNIGLDGRIHFKEGMKNMAYDMIKTPSISREGLKGIPANAVGLLSFDLADSDSMQAAQLRQLVLANLGLDLSAELIDSIQQITLFALPCAEIKYGTMPFRPGLVVACSDTAQVLQFLEDIKEKAGEGGPELLVEAANGVVLASLERDVLDSVKAALAGDDSVSSHGVLEAMVGQYAGNAEKLMLVGLGGIMRWAGCEGVYVLSPPTVTEEVNRQIAGHYEALAKVMESTMLVVHTEEQPNELAIKARLSGIPPLSKIIDPMIQIQRMDAEISEKFARRRAEKRRNRSGVADKKLTATILETDVSPAIDGVLDDVWSKARVYPVEKTVTGIYDREQGSPIAGNEFAAEFRMLWDAEKLYVFMDVTDSTPNHNPDIGWQFSDNAILYIDATDAQRDSFGPTDYEFAYCWGENMANILSEKKHGQMKNVVCGYDNTEKGYCVEIAIPWSTLGTPSPGAGTKIGVDVQVSDNQAGPERNLVIGWQDDTNGAWQHPSLFGRAELAGLVGYWPCDEMEGATLGDKSGRGHDGTFQGNVKWAKGRIGGALDMDGQRSYVQIADESAFDLTGEITIAYWVNIRSVTTDWMPFITKGDTSWRLSTANNREARLHLGAGGAIVSTDKPVGLGEWHHVAATCGGNTMRIYVDGNLAATGTYAGGIAPNNSPVMIGANAEVMDRFFDGLIDEVRVYNRVLNVDEIEELAMVKGE